MARTRPEQARPEEAAARPSGHATQAEQVGRPPNEVQDAVLVLPVRPGHVVARPEEGVAQEAALGEDARAEEARGRGARAEDGAVAEAERVAVPRGGGEQREGEGVALEEATEPEGLRGTEGGRRETR